MHRAIETRYKGRRFRSRLEARYAVFLDALDIVWDYEPEGFELEGGLRYLPDFFLHQRIGTFEPGAGFWVEIKPTMPTNQERVKLMLTVEATGHPGYFFVGPPDRATVYHADLKTWGYFTDGGGITMNGACVHSARLGPHQCRVDGAYAIQQAVAARFEFGESGAK
jgi:hypothetical protein